jgi:hypothetical protein
MSKKNLSWSTHALTEGEALQLIPIADKLPAAFLVRIQLFQERYFVPVATLQMALKEVFGRDIQYFDLKDRDTLKKLQDEYRKQHGEPTISEVEKALSQFVKIKFSNEKVTGPHRVSDAN